MAKKLRRGSVQVKLRLGDRVTHVSMAHGSGTIRELFLSGRVAVIWDYRNENPFRKKTHYRPENLRKIANE